MSYRSSGPNKTKTELGYSPSKTRTELRHSPNKTRRELRCRHESPTVKKHFIPTVKESQFAQVRILCTTVSVYLY